MKAYDALMQFEGELVDRTPFNTGCRFGLKEGLILTVDEVQQWFNWYGHWAGMTSDERDRYLGLLALENL